MAESVPAPQIRQSSSTKTETVMVLLAALCKIVKCTCLAKQPARSTNKCRLKTAVKSYWALAWVSRICFDLINVCEVGPQLTFCNQ